MRCGDSPTTFKVCQKCWMPLDLKTVIEIEEKRRVTDAIMDKLMVRPSFLEFVEREIGGMVELPSLKISVICHQRYGEGR